MKKKYDYPFTPSPFLPELDALTNREDRSSGFTKAQDSADYPERSSEKESREDVLLKPNDSSFPE
ncbi:hypothetical protein J7E71_04805 [Mesobacillus foraminis]|uniref:hypothetical protein n=1 Tax=Mesobacillus foraminis TaxID=279826 RepID=UPI001BEBB7EF|nr:hypothetical protein [Mesobacillus foraminis]MBT2755277.1 hypothetical protein [Mesobacillus foraminis]